MNQKKLIVFDMDDTLITSNTWLSFNTFLGVTEAEDYALYKAFTAQEFDYQTWLTKLIQLYRLPEKNLTQNNIAAVLTDFKLASGAKQAVDYCHKHDLTTALISGSFDVTAQAVAKAVGIEHAVANTSCQYDAQGNLSGLESFGDEGESKVVHLENLCHQLGLNIETDCIAIGDSGNDIPIFQRTDNGITFTWTKPEVQRAARYTIDSLTELPHLLKTNFDF